MTVSPTGVFYGVGVGPGDPELMTLKAVKVLAKCPVLAVPRSPSGSSESGVAFSIVQSSVDLSGKERLELEFPMTRDPAVLLDAREKAAGDISERLAKGKDVAFITLGDPMLYSTFSYLVPLVRERLPGVSIKAVPGVTSVSAAACSAMTTVAESAERVIIVPASYETGELRAWLAEFDTVVLMKVNRKVDAIVELLEEEGCDDSAVFVSRAGWQDHEIITTDLKSLKGKKLDYFSMMIIKKAQGQKV